MEKHHFEQAKIWLSGASLVANLDSGGDDKYAVAVSMAVHAIIKTILDSGLLISNTLAEIK